VGEWAPWSAGDPADAGLSTVDSFAAAAREQLDPATWDYVSGGAGDEAAVAEATLAWRTHRLVPRTMVDVSGLDTSLRLLGLDLGHPLLLAPTATHARYHPRAELETVEGAHAAGALLILGTLASVTPAELGVRAAQISAPWWMQVYLQDDRELARPYLSAAADAGARALVLTVDTPTIGARGRDRREATGAPAGVAYPNLSHLPVPSGGPAPHRRVWNPHLTRTLTPRDISALRDEYGLPVVPKGILRPDDARRAVDAGAAALIVSNHGGRNLDTVLATADALGAVVDAVQGEVPVLVDGGVRRGTDVATALCLGASAVLIGRPAIWGLASYGAVGVQRVVEILRTELEMAMALLGAPRLADLDRTLLDRR